MIKEIQFYYDFSSPYTYIAHKKIKKLKNDKNINFLYKPMLLGGLHKLAGITANAFIGHKNDASDLYLIDLKTEKVTNLTNDIFSDFSPSWSLNGDKVFFSSDQSSYKNNTDISEIDFSKKDIFTPLLG